MEEWRTIGSSQLVNTEYCRRGWNAENRRNGQKLPTNGKVREMHENEEKVTNSDKGAKTALEGLVGRFLHAKNSKMSDIRGDQAIGIFHEKQQKWRKIAENGEDRTV